MKAIIEYGPFSTMIDVVGDHRPIYFPKPQNMLSPFRIEDDVVMENTAHNLEFDYKASITHNGNEVQLYKFVSES